MRGWALALLIVWTHGARADRLTFDPAAIYKVPRGASPTEGPADAPVTIVAWSDFHCGYCQRVQNTLDRLSRLYPGQLRFVHRTLPLDDDLTLTAEAALAAAAQGKYRPMSDRIYALDGKVDRAGLELIARELGLDMLEFRASLDRGAHRTQIEADIADAIALGLTGTPSFFVNGRAVHGNQPLRVFADVVEEELARAAAARGKGRAARPVDHDMLVAAGRPAADTPRGDEERFQLDVDETYRVGLGLPGHQLGPDDALVTIVVWGDFQCPFCAKLAPVLAHLRQKFPADVRIVYRHLAMAFHRKAVLAAEAGVAAAEQGKFWPFHDQVYAAGARSIDRKDLERSAEAAGLDMAKFRAALDDRRHHDTVLAESASAEALGVDGTPTLFVNGRPLIGSRDPGAMERIVEEHLAAARGAVRAGVAAADFYAVAMSGAKGVERADPSSVPDLAAVKVTLRNEDLGRAVVAACRRRDLARATRLAGTLAGETRRRVIAVCAAAGVDL